MITDMENTTYHYWDYFTATRRQCRCRIIEYGQRTLLIKLLDFGPKGKPPGTVMRVHKKSVDWKKVIDCTELSWHQYTDI